MPLPLLGRTYNFCYLFLFIWSSFVVPKLLPCDLCVRSTRLDYGVVKILVYRIHFSCMRKVIGTCEHSKTTYSICRQGNQHICFDPGLSHTEEWLEVRSFHSKVSLITKTLLTSPQRPASLIFDACAAIAKNPPHHVTCGSLLWEREYMFSDKYMCPKYNPGNSDCHLREDYFCPYWSCVMWATRDNKDRTACLQKSVATSDCKTGTCNPVNFTIFTATEKKWQRGYEVSLRISGRGVDPGTTLYITRTTVYHNASVGQIFLSFREDIGTEDSDYTVAKHGSDYI